MNKHTYITGLFLLVASASGFAQTDPAAKALLSRVSKTYEGYKTIQADFTLSVQQPQQPGYTESGTIYMEAGVGKYHISMTSQDLISDGKTQWVVLKEEKEVQVTDADGSSDAISPITIFSFYNTGYKYVSAPDEKAGGNDLHVVELSPEDARAPYFKIKLRINKSNNLIHDATLFDKGGLRYTYAFKNTKANPQIGADKFSFNPGSYPGMEIVDLR